MVGGGCVIRPIGLLEFKPLRKAYSMLPITREGIYAKRNWATAIIGDQGWNLQSINRNYVHIV